MKEHLLVIGAGSIGKRHIQNLLTLGYTDITVFDPSMQALDGVSNDVQKTTDFGKALGSGCSCAFICSPAQYHVIQAVECVKKDMDIFIEKPLSHSLSSVDELLHLSKDKDKIIFTACNFRFHKVMKRVKDLVNSKSLGDALFSRAIFGGYVPEWRKGSSYVQTVAAMPDSGGVIFDAAIHLIDYLQWIFGKAILHSSTVTKQGNLDMSTEDYADLTLKHSNDMLSFIHADYLNRKYTHGGEIICERGTIGWDLVKNTVSIYNAETKEESIESYPYSTEYGPNDMYLGQFKYFFECIKDKKSPMNGIIESRDALIIALKAKESRI